MFKAQVIGNLGADAQVKNINGVEYVAFDVAHSWKENGSERTVWVGCLSRGLKNALPFLKKGVKVYVCGDLSGRIYDSSHYHCKMISYSIFVDTMQLCSSLQESKGQPSKSVYDNSPIDDNDDENEPF